MLQYWEFGKDGNMLNFLPKRKEKKTYLIESVRLKDLNGPNGPIHVDKNETYRE